MTTKNWRKKNEIKVLSDRVVVYLRGKHGGETVCDLDDLDTISAHTWRSHKGQYAISGKDGSRLSRLLMGAPPDKVVDHINGDSLDNRRKNLRVCSAAENSRNKTRNVRCYHYDKRLPKNPYFARITFNYKKIIVGYFPTKEEAIAAHKNAQKFYFGDFAPS